MSLGDLARRRIREGALTIRLPGGQLVEVGDGTGPQVQVALTSRGWAARIAANPDLALGEAYTDGGLVLEGCELWDLFELVGRNAKHRLANHHGSLSRWWLDRRLHRNARKAARRNVAHHYDLSNEFYREFLDPDLQYSCAYFAESTFSLEEAQAAKKQHIARKLRIQPGDRVLDIGCGWGGMALTLASEWGAAVDGVTLSSEQLALAKARSRQAGLTQSIRFSLTDYRDVTGAYDRIVSVGMFEHVGRLNYQAYFDQIARLLNDDGVALVHSIGRSAGPEPTQPWIAKYIFPGGYIPALSEVFPAIERAGLIVADLEVLRLHYAETLRCWRERFMKARTKIVQQFDERFCRMWEFYLCASEMAFRYGGNMVFQLQLTKRVDQAPLTRDYLYPVRPAAEATESRRSACQVA